MPLSKQSFNGVDLKYTSQGQRYSGVLFNGKRGWADLEGHELMPSNGAVAPQRDLITTGNAVYANSYDTNDVFDLTYHLTHAECKDGDNDKFFHVHAGLAVGAVASGANLVITANLHYTKLYAAGRNMAVIPSLTKTLTSTPAQLNAAGGGNHILLGGDTLIAKNGGGVGLWDCVDGLAATDIWFPDDLIFISCTVTSVPTITGGVSNRVLFPRRDIHREVSTGGSVQRVYPFGWS